MYQNDALDVSFSEKVVLGHQRSFEVENFGKRSYFVEIEGQCYLKGMLVFYLNSD